MTNPAIRARWDSHLADAAEALNDAHAEMVRFVIAAAQNGMTQQDIATATGKSKSWVHNVLKANGLRYERKAVSSG